VGDSDVTHIAGFIDDTSRTLASFDSIADESYREWLQCCGNFLADTAKWQPHGESHQLLVEWQTGKTEDGRKWYRRPVLEPPSNTARILLCCMYESISPYSEEDGVAIARACFASTRGRRGLINLIRSTRILASISIQQKTFVGWVPNTTRIGDELCILYGAPWPLVVRRQPDEQTFTVVGDAYFDQLTERKVLQEGNAAAVWHAARRLSFVGFKPMSPEGAQEILSDQDGMRLR
jgi:hypothetical protein